MGDWSQVGENLVKHSAGTYYLRAKVGGKVIRESLKTKDLRIAKLKRDARLQAIRGAASTGKYGTAKTLGDFVALLKKDLIDRPHIAAKTQAYCKDLIRILTDSLPLETSAKAWTRYEAQDWWMKLAKRYSASVANKTLGAVKRMCAIMIEHGVRPDDPSRELKRMQHKHSMREIPATERMKELIEFIRGQKKRGCEESARFVAFLAFTGMRKGELAALRWENIDKDWITVGADGNTKGKSFRRVPISTNLREVIELWPQDQRKGQIFMMKSPRRAVFTACEKLGIPELRVHDTRHFFATMCIQNGVDIPTVAKWLGHKDGGVLAMRTYSHVTDEHSLASAKKLK